MSALKFLIKIFMSAIFEEKLLTISQYFDPKNQTLQAFKTLISLIADNIFKIFFILIQTLQAHPKYFCSEIILQGLRMN